MSLLEDEAIRAIDLIVRHTTCPDPGEGGCIGGPIPGYGCEHEAARAALKWLKEERDSRRRAPTLEVGMDPKSLLLDLRGRPGLAVGLRVRTASAIDPRVGDYMQPRDARPNVTGVVERYHDSHGLCFDVKHDDPETYGYSGTYEPNELTIIYER